MISDMDLLGKARRAYFRREMERWNKQHGLIGPSPSYSSGLMKLDGKEYVVLDSITA